VKVEPAVTVEREMGCTRPDLLRWLPGAARHAGAEPVEDGLTLRLGTGQVRLELEERPARRLAAVVLPVLRVCFVFRGIPAAARARFLERFDAYTRRGGG
jgi:hypothetical protein